MRAERAQWEQQAEREEPWMWVAADYHFPSTYSCRIPMSSISTALAMPTPGPATVRLALIRTGIKLFGLEMTRDELFPVIREMTVRVRPPERVAISQHTLRAYKWSGGGKTTTLQESITTREMAQARGLMTVYLQVPVSMEPPLCALLQGIGY